MTVRKDRFHTDVSGILARVAPSSAGFVCLGAENVLTYSVVRWTAAHPEAEPRTWALSVAELLPLDWQEMLHKPRRAYHHWELGLPAATSQQLPVADRNTQRLIVVLHSDGRLHGIVGLQRGADEPRFSTNELCKVEALAEVVSLAAEAHVASRILACENAALKAFGHRGAGVLLLVDADAGAVIWASRQGQPLVWQADVAPIARNAIDLAMQSRGEVSAEQRALNTGEAAESLTVAAIDIDGSELGVDACTAIHVNPAARPDAAVADTETRLSTREREVASFLVDGYSNVNIAAITGLSENTIRTYIRRLYRKLGICSRVDLVRFSLAQSAK